jgi:hypothetical protein
MHAGSQRWVRCYPTAGRGRCWRSFFRSAGHRPWKPPGNELFVLARGWSRRLSRGRDPSRRWWRNLLQLTAATCGRLVSIRGARSRFSSLRSAAMRGSGVVFASVPAEATSQTRQLRGVLHGLGATPATPVTILSDLADGPRSLAEAASPGPTHQQQMRWSPRGAHLMLKVRTSVANSTLDRDYAVAARWARRPFRRATPHVLDGLIGQIRAFRAFRPGQPAR